MDKQAFQPEPSSSPMTDEDDLVPTTELDPFDWGSFSTVDVWRNRISWCVQRFKCMFLHGQHRWEVLVRPWNLTKVSSLEDYRTLRANKLRCVCCGKTCFVKDADLSEMGVVLYRFRTTILAKYYPNFNTST